MIVVSFGGFLIFFLIYSFIFKIGVKHEYKINNQECMKRTYNKNRGTYIDYYGCERKLDGEPCFTSRTIYGDIIQQNKYGDIIRNFDEEKRLSKIDGSVIELTGYSVSDSGRRRYEADGCRYKDKKNGKIYCVRSVQYDKYKYALFYMDVNDGKLIRPSDTQLKIDKELMENGKSYLTNEEYRKIIEKENNKFRNPKYPIEFYRNNEVSKDYD